MSEASTVQRDNNVANIRRHCDKINNGCNYNLDCQNGEWGCLLQDYETGRLTGRAGMSFQKDVGEIRKGGLHMPSLKTEKVDLLAEESLIILQAVLRYPH
jgi:hypothetical protein